MTCAGYRSFSDELKWRTKTNQSLFITHFNIIQRKKIFSNKCPKIKSFLGYKNYYCLQYKIYLIQIKRKTVFYKNMIIVSLFLRIL